MAILDKKFSIPGTFSGHRVVELPDSPSQAGINAFDLKTRFDEGANIIGGRVNDIIDALLATTADDSGAHNIGSATIAGVTGSTVAAQLASLQQNIVDTQAGQVVPGSVDDAKLNQNSPNLYARFDAHQKSLSAHTLVALSAGTPSAYTITDGVSTWETLSAKPFLFLVAMHMACDANATAAICGGPAQVITVSSGGGVGAGQLQANGFYLFYWHPANSTLYVLNPEMKTAFIYKSSTPAVTNGAVWLRPV